MADLMSARGHEGVVALEHHTRWALRSAWPGQVGVVDHPAHTLPGQRDGAGLDVDPHSGSCPPDLPTAAGVRYRKQNSNCILPRQGILDPAHHDILYYFGVHFASTFVIFPKLMVRSASRARGVGSSCFLSQESPCSI